MTNFMSENGIDFSGVEMAKKASGNADSWLLTGADGEGVECGGVDIVELGRGFKLGSFGEGVEALIEVRGLVGGDWLASEEAHHEVSWCLAAEEDEEEAEGDSPDKALCTS